MLLCVRLKRFHCMWLTSYFYCYILHIDSCIKKCIKYLTSRVSFYVSFFVALNMWKNCFCYKVLFSQKECSYYLILNFDRANMKSICLKCNTSCINTNSHIKIDNYNGPNSELYFDQYFVWSILFIVIFRYFLFS